MRYSLTVATPPASEPVSLELAKAHLRVDHDAEDDLIRAWIPAARELCEAYAGRRFLTQTLRLQFDAFPAWELELPVEPVASVTSIVYRDEDGVSQTLPTDDYQTWLDHSPPLVSPVADGEWPETEADRLGAVTVTLVAGTPVEVPESLRAAVLLTLGFWDGNRGDGAEAGDMGLPAGAKRLLDTLWTGRYR